ncbi:conjugal transfer protein TraA, partial [Enterococcus faecalis]|nr:conjugal transfer protein TraA [Enterococcus faecalis]EIA6642102.1 conjugal transfer protein TraA [Enterococcus faecalis]
MPLNELMKFHRKELQLSQEEFYSGIFLRKSATQFEVHNKHSLKITDIPTLLDRSELSLQELINYSPEEFTSEFDKDLSYYYQLADTFFKENNPKTKKEIECFYQK